MINLSDYILLRFLMNYGHIFQAMMTREEAKDLVIQWGSGGGEIPGKLVIMGQDPVTGSLWALLVKEVLAMHTLEIPPQTPSPSPAPHHPPEPPTPSPFGPPPHGRAFPRR